MWFEMLRARENSCYSKCASFLTSREPRIPKTRIQLVVFYYCNVPLIQDRLSAYQQAAGKIQFMAVLQYVIWTCSYFHLLHCSIFTSSWHRGIWNGVSIFSFLCVAVQSHFLTLKAFISLFILVNYNWHRMWCYFCLLYKCEGLGAMVTLSVS